jgi:hypothetical protein
MPQPGAVSYNDADIPEAKPAGSYDHDRCLSYDPYNVIRLLRIHPLQQLLDWSKVALHDIWRGTIQDVRQIEEREGLEWCDRL